MATYTYTKQLNYDKFVGEVELLSTFAAKMDHVEYDGYRSDITNNVRVVTTLDLTSGEISELDGIVANHVSTDYEVSSDITFNEREAGAIMQALGAGFSASFAIFLFDDADALDVANSSNIGLLRSAEVLCQNDPAQTATIYTTSATARPRRMGFDMSWNGQGTVTVFGSRNDGNPASATWTQLTRGDMTAISPSAHGTTTRLKIVLTGGAALNWIGMLYEVFGRAAPANPFM